MKNIFIKSTIILIIGTIISKILGFFIKIIFTRIIGEGIIIYSLILPTYSLLVAITQLGLPYSISTVMAKNNNRGIHIIASIIPITLIFNILIILLVIFISPYLSCVLLKNPDTYYPIISICFVLPFTTISGIIKGYYFGKQNAIPNSISMIFEQLTRFLLLITLIPYLLKKSIVIAVSGYIIVSAISELIQIIIYLFFLPKKAIITLNDLKVKIPLMNEILSISIPTLSGRLIGNICYFLEPIILTFVLSFIGYSTTFIGNEYAIYNAYVIPILTMPGFFTMAVNTTIIPEVSKNSNNKKYIKKLLISTCLFFGIIGSLYCIYLFFNSTTLQSILYHTTEGESYIKILSIFFPLFYIEGPIVSILQGLKLAKHTFNTTLIGCIIKLIVMTILSFFSIGIYGLIISEIINIIIIDYLNIKKLYKLGFI